MKRNDNLIRVQVLGQHHVSQLTLEHYWPWESRFDFNTVKVLGRLAKTGDILCRNKTDSSLRVISAVAYIDWQFAQVGGILQNGEYAPTPHTEYFQKAKQAWSELPQLFTD